VNKKPADELKEFPDEVRAHLQRADGFLDLAMTKQARAELDQIPEPYSGTALVRMERLRLAFTEKDWAVAASYARELLDIFPDDFSSWTNLSYAVRRAVGIGAAKKILLDALKRFGDCALIRFNLACYDCQLGNMPEALDWLKEAVELDAKYGEAALEDEDLKPLWDRIG
jgi:tetratricopeptide (TPR) repeat protein